MNVHEIVIQHLKKINADGLCTDDCGCSIDDLAPCGIDFGFCVPAQKTTNPDAYYGIDDTYYIPITESES